MENTKGTSANFLAEVGLESLHQESRRWMSQIDLWKTELTFFQKLMDRNSEKFTSTEAKKELDHFQNLIIYYNGELLDQFRKKTRKHKKGLSRTMKNKDNIDETTHRNQHIIISNELKSLQHEYYQYKKEFFKFMEGII